MKFVWQYKGSQPAKLRTVLRSFGATNSLLKVAVYHGGSMAIDGQASWLIDTVEPGQSVSLVLPAEAANDQVDSCSLPITVAYEDQDFLVINKPAGVATVPAHHVAVQDSLVNRVKYYYQQHHYENQVTHVATRLDKDTSGLVIFPKHRFAHAILDRQLKKHQVVKRYLALPQGRIDIWHGYIDAPQRRDPQSFVKRMVAADGKPAVTEYWRVASGDKYSLVQIALHTGRTHQIRVHFAFIGHPLIGDDMYGGEKLMDRQGLHCRYLSFYSPFQNKQIEVSAELPADMKAKVDSLMQH